MPSGFSRSKIYEVLIPPENQVKFRSNYVKGKIRDKVSQSPLTARIELINIERNDMAVRGQKIQPVAVDPDAAVPEMVAAFR